MLYVTFHIKAFDSTAKSTGTKNIFRNKSDCAKCFYRKITDRWIGMILILTLSRWVVAAFWCCWVGVLKVFFFSFDADLNDNNSNDGNAHNESTIRRSTTQINKIIHMCSNKVMFGLVNKSLKDWPVRGSNPRHSRY